MLGAGGSDSCQLWDDTSTEPAPSNSIFSVETTGSRCSNAVDNGNSINVVESTHDLAVQIRKSCLISHYRRRSLPAIQQADLSEAREAFQPRSETTDSETPSRVRRQCLDDLLPNDDEAELHAVTNHKAKAAERLQRVRRRSCALLQLQQEVMGKIDMAPDE